MPAFLKNPKVVLGTILVVWVAYVLYENFQLEPVRIKLIPFAATLDFRVSAVIIGSALFGALTTLAVQYIWRRRRVSKPGDESVAVNSVSSKTVA